MATKKKTNKKKPARKRTAKPSRFVLARRYLQRGLAGILGALTLWVLLYAFVPVPTTPYMVAERFRHGSVSYDWVPLQRVAPVMARAAVAAEDANFCRHWGFDMSAIRDAISEGGQRGASTISQQVVKNAFLWQGRSWPRKALEASLTPAIELFWSKRRVLEVYLNVAEFDRGVFGVEAAARRYYGISATDLSSAQAARLAVLLPNPKERAPSELSTALQRRAEQIADGAETIRRDGRADCFED